MTQVIIPANATESEEDAILNAAVDSREGQSRIRTDINSLDANDTLYKRGATKHVVHVDESPFTQPQNDTDDEIPGDETYALSSEGFGTVQVEVPGAEEAALSGEEHKETKVVVLGVPSPNSGAAALINAGLASTKESNETTEQPKPGNLPYLFLSNAERKRRAAADHNARIKPHKFTLVQMRANGLTIRLDVKRMTQREVTDSKACGYFVVYSKNSVASARRIAHLPIAQHHKSNLFDPVLLDWILDQADETVAFEIRNGRLPANQQPTLYVTKSEAEWKAKGFDVLNGQIVLG